MSILNKLSSALGRRDEVPNQELAIELIKTKNHKGIKEAAENLFNNNKMIQNDCIKVLYEIGYKNPELIKDYAESFIRLLKSRNNRLVWGSMTALSTIALISADKLMKSLDKIITAVKTGSVITEDSGIKTLANIASAKEEYNNEIFPIFINHLKTLRPKQIPMHAEFIFKAVNENNKNAFIEVLKSRMDILTARQQNRINKILKKVYKNE